MKPRILPAASVDGPGLSISGDECYYVNRLGIKKAAAFVPYDEVPAAAKRMLELHAEWNRGKVPSRSKKDKSK